jgi:hypothetical protein
MQAVSSWFARALAALGGPAPAAVILVAGVIVGGVGGVMVTSGSSTASGGTVSVYPCPNQGPALLTIAGGQQLLVTGRTADSAWVRIHLPTPGRTEGWVEAGPLTINGSLDTLPVASCGAVAGAPSPRILAVPSLTAIVNAPPSPGPTPTATPTSVPSPTVSSIPSPSASPSASPGPPALAKLAASARTISYDQGSYCPNAVKSVTISVTATDAAGVSAVTLFWRAPGAAAYRQTPMSLHSGTAANGVWQVKLSTATDGITKAGTLAYYAIAANASGGSARIPLTGSSTIAVAVCANTGPTITSVASSAGSSLYWDPLGVGTCQTATDITAAVADVDGVKSVTLYFRRPGSATWSSKPMDSQTVAGKWYANLDTLGDEIPIATPPNGTLSWYLKAVDGKNASSQTKTASTTVLRCDSRASFDGVFPTSQTYSCGAARIQIGTYANDPDQPNNGLQVVFYWTLTNTRTKAKVSGSMASDLTRGNEYFGTTDAFTGKTFYYGVLTAYVVTTDQYGGTTTSPISTTTNLSCK